MPMSEDPISSELRAAAASLVTATAAAEASDWITAEQGALDAQHRVARVMKAISLKLLDAERGSAPKPAKD
jgi:hypothetical protein